MSAIRRAMMGKGGGEKADNYIYYGVFVASNNTSRYLWTGSTDLVAEMWLDGVQITPVASMTFATAGTYQMKVLLTNPATIPNSALNAGHYRDAILPACVTYIDTNAFRNYGTSGVTPITCLATTPPALNGDPFYNRHGNPLYVPADSVTAYQTAWSMMTNISAITT